MRAHKMSARRVIHPIVNQIHSQQLLSMLELLPDVIFWIKDQHSKIIHANQLFVEHLGFKTAEQIIGKSDLDFSPPHMAKQFIVDDQKVLAGDSVTDRLEMNVNKEGELAWFSTSKRPLFNEDGDIIGTYGMSRHLQKTVKTLSSIDALKIPIEYIRANFHIDINIEQLAKISHLSVSALERRFKKHLAKTPKQFIRQIRLEHARRLLVETKLPVAEIAYQSGFADHSYFSRHFKMMFEELPSALRLAISEENTVEQAL